MNDIEEITIFKSTIEVCNIHKERIQMAYEMLNQKFPFTADKIEHLSPLELGMSELLINRFSKLQDTIGEKIFPHVLTLLGENIYQKSFIDRLNMLEKLGIIKDANQWQNYRTARNAATHEYPDNLNRMAENLNHVMTLSQELVTFWMKLQQLILSKMD
jgi:hypothetical protein